MKIKVINGPNINMLGKRETSIYGDTTYDDLIKTIDDYCKNAGVVVDFYQSNIEGEIVTEIQNSLDYDGIVINPAAYTHTSIALHDALRLYDRAIVEVHLSNIHARESFREKSVTASAARGVITGLGLKGYLLAIDYIINA